jgi:hypothetical protein
VWWYPQPASPPQLPQPAATRVPAPGRKKPARSEPQTAPLFDTDTLAPVDNAPTITDAPGGRDKVDELLRSPLFTQQFQTYGRNLKKPQLGALVRETIAAGGVLPMLTAAQLLGVKSTRASGALSVVAQVLNTDGVEVLTINGTELQLREALMFEQFGVTGPGAHP